ncbi:CapA family protein [Hymenobacter sp. RP-2-7]|uniref:CapA family protein n=1 Tax=Hymenobacter polaris TaxID=2682546 RepID=A0A7Y0AII6_9BACT|nr:CapA family protein [Hymenobacter polaris]NML68018.1 CapA family protein [Hymenobacter polaris]
MVSRGLGYQAAPRRWPSLLLLLALAACGPAPPPALRISVVGDVLLARAVPAALARDSAALRQTARQLWAGSRYVLGNLECPLTDTALPASKAIVFQGNPRWAGWLRGLGVTHVSLANNHTLDQRLPGLQATVRAGRAAGLGVLGYEPDSLAGCLPTVLGADSSVVAFAYSAFGQAGAGEGCVCGREAAALCERVATYKTLFPERAVLVYLHWGTEYAAQPSARQRQLAHDLVDAGAAAVVGAHPHVVQPVEFYRGRPIVYSLGNFLFDQRGGATALGVQVDFEVAHGWVTATTLRPLRLAGAVPQPAEAAARQQLQQRLLPADSSAQLLAQAPGSWLARAMAAPSPSDSLPAYLVPHLVLGGPAGTRTQVRLRYLPRARQYQVQASAGAGEGRVLALGFPVYRLAQGDVDNDGRPDLLVGPVKRTRLDATVRRRLFVYCLDSTGRLQPRWRGSRLLFELVFFRAWTTAGRTYVLSIEREPAGSYCVGQYYWQGFGLVLDRFRARRLGRAAAYRAFVQPER